MRFQSTKANNEISIYKGELTSKCITECIAKVKLAYPRLQPGFFDLLIEDIKELGFTDKRLIDAIKHVRRTCPYPEPTIANFLQFDKTLTLYNYREMTIRVTEKGFSFDDHCKIKKNNQVFWIEKSEMAKHNITVDEIQGY
jgi:hypothetical protein